MFKPVLIQEEAIHYVSNYEIIKFISENSEMEWNSICDFVRDNNIIGEEGKCYWTKSDITNSDTKTHYNPEAVKWVGAFFEAHSWIENMMIVFDD